MHTQAIRRKFLDYFKEKQHIIVPSSSVVPHDDPTLLFNNAGMNQFKDVFLGKTKRDYTRATSSQKCIRVGGKHNDLENVGHTTRHLTFFEMLGNFSFGDYFKKEAIQFAWDVSTKIFEFDPERIWPTVYKNDDEAFELWTQYVPAERITRFGEKENFWAMGDTGPCGPCSELLYDRGDSYGDARNPSQDPSGERFLEYWNLVFMQFNRLANGEVENLPRPSIDTGAGLERVVDLKMGVKTVFETDVIRSIIAQVESVTGIPYHLDDQKAPAFRVIADHLRCLSFAIADGVQPSNVDRGYVLRKVLRRAVRYGRQLGMDRPFLADVLPQLIETMGEDYPELIQSQHRIAEILTLEEEAFIRTLRRGGNILSQIIEKGQHSSDHMINGDDAFKLKDTYGLPLEEILLIAKDSNLNVDETRYQLLETEAKERSRNVQKSVNQIAEQNIFEEFAQKEGSSTFIGYTQTEAQTKVKGIFSEGQFINTLSEGQEGMVFLEHTPFYAEMGGQVGDTGTLLFSNGLFKVINCIAPYKGLHAHVGIQQKGTLKVGDEVQASIDATRRRKIENNHTATHLLHWALHHVLGEHIKQAGSVVDENRLRFDFSHHKGLSLDETRQIEDLVNQKIRENRPVASYEIPYTEAIKKPSIKQFFGEKYGNVVRVIDIDYSQELCGGTHTSFVGNVGLFKIKQEGSIGAGMRRIEAVTGDTAEAYARESEDLLITLANRLKCAPHLILERLDKCLEEQEQLNTQLKNLRIEQLNTFAEKAAHESIKIGNINTYIQSTHLAIDELRPSVDKIMEKLKSGIVILATTLPDKCQLVAKVSDDLIQQGFSANDLLKAVFSIIEGSGGGKPQMAQGGGKLISKLPEALDKIRELISQRQ